MRHLCADIHQMQGEPVCLYGWVHIVRTLKSVSFVILRDRSGKVQLVYESDLPHLTNESVIQVRGKAVANSQAFGGTEVHVSETKVLSLAATPLPLAVHVRSSEYGLDATLEHRFTSLRNPAIKEIFSIQSTILWAFSHFLRKKGFTEIKTSKLIEGGTEGGTGLFEVEYFDTHVYLAQSPQFYKQAMMASGLERVFESAPAYRAEKHDTGRHLNEYISLDVEMAFIENEHDLMDLEEALLREIFTEIHAHHADSQYVNHFPDPESSRKIPRISYQEAKEVLKQRLNRNVFDIPPEAERELCVWAEEEHGTSLLFVHSYPRKKRPFYAFFEGQSTRSFDLLFRGLEITTGGQRIHEYEMLLSAIQNYGLDPESLHDYCEIFKYGCPPHGGFAIGLERLTQKILNLANVKEASAFPRDRRRTRP